MNIKNLLISIQEKLNEKFNLNLVIENIEEKFTISVKEYANQVSKNETFDLTNETDLHDVLCYFFQYETEILGKEIQENFCEIDEEFFQLIKNQIKL